MVDELTQEAFSTGKAVVSISVDLIKSIVEAIKKAQIAHPGMTKDQEDSLFKKVIDKAVSDYKNTHGSLGSFNKDGKEITNMEVTDGRIAAVLRDCCKEAKLPFDMKQTSRADGTSTFTFFVEIGKIDQLATLLKLSSEKVLEEERAVNKSLVILDENDQPVYNMPFARISDIDFEKMKTDVGDVGKKFQILNASGEVINETTVKKDLVDEIKKTVKKVEPKKQKDLSKRIKDKKQESMKKSMDRNRERARKKELKKDKNKSL